MGNGIYHLCQEHNKTKEKLYFNFDVRQFIDYSKEENKTVSLATIDLLTTSCSSEQEFIDLLKRSGYDKKDATMFISYEMKREIKKNSEEEKNEPKEKKEYEIIERKLAPVFNDPFLHFVAETTKGKKDGSINTENSKIKETLYRIYKILITPNNGLFERIAVKREMNSNTYGLNEHNYNSLKDLPRNVYYSTEENSRFYFSKFVKHFSNYKEFRSLYLNCVSYYKQRERERAEKLKSSQDDEKAKTYKL